MSTWSSPTPGHVGTDIAVNTRRARGKPGPEQLSEAELAAARAWLAGAGLLAEGAPDDELRQTLARLGNDFRDKAPLSAAQAATIILDGVRSGFWRILVGEDAKMIDAAVRAKPAAAYDYDELFSEVTVGGSGTQTAAAHGQEDSQGNEEGR
jgi:hypothetical protein